MNKRIGFIGAGKMAQAMIEGILKSNIIPKENIIASAKTAATIKTVKSNYQIRTTLDNQEAARFADILILAVKPHQHSLVIQEIRNEINHKCIIITVAAGITLADIEHEFGFAIKAVRTMPNTPSLVGEGMSAICYNERLTNEDKFEVERLFQTFGKTERLDERLMNAVPAISGSSPAYVYMLIEAMADGGVKQGIPRDKAYRLAAQAVLGAAKMVLDTGRHTGELIDNVCTPGGATVEAVEELERWKFRGSVLAAMESCTEKVKSL